MSQTEISYGLNRISILSSLATRHRKYIYPKLTSENCCCVTEIS